MPTFQLLIMHWIWDCAKDYYSSISKQSCSGFWCPSPGFWLSLVLRSRREDLWAGASWLMLFLLRAFSGSPVLFLMRGPTSLCVSNFFGDLVSCCHFTLRPHVHVPLLLALPQALGLDWPRKPWGPCYFGKGEQVRTGGSLHRVWQRSTGDGSFGSSSKHFHSFSWWPASSSDFELLYES